MNHIKGLAQVLGFALALSACGGGGGGNAGTSSVTPGSVTTTQSAVAGGASLATVASVTLPTGSAPVGTTSVVTFGQVFGQGEASDHVVVNTGGVDLPTQTDVKRRYADGSIRHAIVSVQVAAASAPQALTIKTTGAAASGSPLSLDAVLAGGVDYTVEITEAGAVYRAALRDALQGKTDTWLSGPLVTEWRARVAPSAGVTPHPALRVVFDARFSTPAQGRVSVALENVESTADRGDRMYDLRILDKAGTAVFARTGITQYHQTRFRQVFHFGGASAQSVLADAASLMRSQAIFQYTSADITSDMVASLYSNWQATKRDLFDTGVVRSAMPDSGGRPDIGPLPGWTVTALLSGDARAYQVMYDAAERAGVFSIHYRDAQTSDIISINQHPTLNVGGSGEWSDPADRLPPSARAASSPHIADTAHQPSLVYVPYIVSGDRFYLDELYFWANYNLISMSFDARSREKGLLHTDQVRGQAWSLRSLAHAAWIAPDTDWQKAYFTDKVQQNVSWYRANAIPMNPLGWWRGTSDWDGSVALSPDGNMAPGVAYYIAPWMHDFFAITLAQLSEQGFGAEDVRNWALGFTVKRFTSEPDFRRMDGTAYHLAAVLKGNKPIKTMSDLYYYSFAGRKTGVPTALPFTGDPGGYAIQALATLGAANDAGISRASQGYQFVRGEILKKGGVNAYLSDPTWNIVPRKAVSGLTSYVGVNPPGGSLELPGTDNLPRNADGSISDTWFAQLPLNQWVEVPGSRLLDNIAIPVGFHDYDLSGIVSAWGGAALDTKRNGLHLFGGGHSDGCWNGLLFFSFDSYRWKVTWPGTPASQVTSQAYNCSTDANGDSLNADGNPMASHGWYGFAWIPETDQLFLGVRRNVLWDFASGQWRKPFLDIPNSHWANDIQAWPYNGKVYVSEANVQYGGWVFDPAGTTTLTNGTVAVGSYATVPGWGSAYPTLWEQIAVHMPERGEVFRMRPQDKDHPPHVLTLGDFSRTYAVDPMGKGWEAAFTTLPYIANNLSGAAFAPGATRADDRIYLFENGGAQRMWVINPNDWSGQQLSTTGTPPSLSRTGYYSRFNFDRKHGVLMAIYSVNNASNDGPEVPNVRIMRVR